MGLATEAPVTPAAPSAPGFGLLAHLKVVAYWVSLGAAAGGLGGALIGGIGGRIAMFVLRLTSDDSVRGIRSDDDFIIGRFNFADTANLLFVTALLGSVVGLIVVAGRPFFPKTGMPFAWAFAGAITGGAILVNKDGVDFTLLEPHLLAVALFVAIPCVGAGLIAWLTELYPRFWWRNWWLTGVGAAAGLPAVVLFPLLVPIVTWWLAMSAAPLRALPGWKPARIAAIAVFGVIVVLGLLDLTSDARAIL